MKQIRVVIIDDEPIAVEVIRELITQLAPDLHVEGIASNGVDAVEKINSLKPDLVFMDVDMPYMNGLQVIQKLTHQSFALLFTTGYESGSLKSMRQHAVDFLLKPIDPAEFVVAINKARQKLENDNNLHSHQ